MIRNSESSIANTRFRSWKELGGVKVVTDGACDIPPEVVRDLGITVVPLSLHDGGEMTIAQKARSHGIRLAQAASGMRASPPAISHFEAAYRRLARRTSAVISIHLSSKLSGTLMAALSARQAMSSTGAQIAVVDSLSASMGQGMIVIEAAKAAKAGASLAEVTELVRCMIPQTHVVFFVNNFDGAERAEEVSKPRLQSLGTLLPVSLFRLDDGTVVPFEKARTRAKALEGLFNFVEDFPHVEQLAILYSESTTDVDALLGRIDPVFSRHRVMLTRYGPVLSTYLGPDAIGVVAYEGEDNSIHPVVRDVPVFAMSQRAWS
jgi:DegV family protein with EDD domain